MFEAKKKEFQAMNDMSLSFLRDVPKKIDVFVRDQMTKVSAVIEGNATIAMYNNIQVLALPKRLADVLTKSGKTNVTISDDKKIRDEMPTFAHFDAQKVGNLWKFESFRGKECDDLVVAYPKGVTLENATQPQGKIRQCSLQITRMLNYLDEIGSMSMSDDKLDSSILH